jgi:hypothetical protein
MKCLIFGQLFVLLAISLSVQASQIREEIKDKLDEMNVENCVETMGGIAKVLDGMNQNDYHSELKAEGHESILHDLWKLKINLHERLRNFYRTSELTKNCADASRAALKAIRTTEDYISFNFFKTNTGSVKFPDDAFEENNLHVMRHPDAPGFHLLKDLKSGDIILTRGNAYTSAAIANLGEYDTQFSHMSMVYRDNAGKLWTVEAHIEVGSFVRPIEDHIKDKNYRTMIYRFENEELAAKAAEFIFNKVKKASDTKGNINYDFGFNQDDSTELFCSEIVSHAIEHVSGGDTKIPFIRSRLMVRKPDFVKMLGIKADASFVPADIEVDPRFKILTEWRDAKKTIDNLQKDAVLQAMFSWNDDHGYNMIQGAGKKAFLYRNIAWPMRRVPFLKKYFVEKMPLNMSRELIGYFGVLESVGELLQRELNKEEVEAVESNGLPLMKIEKFKFLEQLRIKESPIKDKLHKLYRPTRVK